MTYANLRNRVAGDGIRMCQTRSFLGHETKTHVKWNNLRGMGDDCTGCFAAIIVCYKAGLIVGMGMRTMRMKRTNADSFLNSPGD